MALTIVGIFNNHSEASKAVDELVNQGFDRNGIDLFAHVQASDSGVRSFFDSLFDENANRYVQAANQKSVVTVHVQTEDKAELALDTLDANGAIALNDPTPIKDSLTTEPSQSMGAAFLSKEELEAANQAAEVARRQRAAEGVRLRSQLVARSIAESSRLR